MKISQKGTVLTVTMEDGERVIPDGAFQKRKGVTEIRLPHGVTRIGDYAFAYCPALVRIHIPTSVKEIGKRAISGLNGVELIYSGTRKAWEKIKKTHTEKGEVLIRGEWDRYPYYNSDGTHYETRETTVSFSEGVFKYTVRFADNS